MKPSDWSVLFGYVMIAQWVAKHNADWLGFISIAAFVISAIQYLGESKTKS